MRKIFTLITVLALSFAGKSQLLTEPFNYTPSPTLGLAVQSGSAWGIINAGDSILVEAGSLTYPGLASSTGNKVKYDGAGTDYYTNFASQTTGSVYASFLVNISSIAPLTGTTGGYFTGVLQGGSTTSFGSAVWTRLSTTAGKYNIGISTRSNSAVTWIAADFTPGTTVFIVTAYDINTGTPNDVSRIWINPVPGAAEPAATATAVPPTADLTSVARYFLRQENTANTPFIEFDELRVGITWASVTPSGALPPPALSASPLTAFGNVCINTTAGPNSFTLTGTNLSTANITVGALAGYTYSTTSGGTYTSSLNLTQPGGSYSQAIFVQFTPTAVQSYAGNITVAGGGVSSFNVAASGSGINTLPTVTSGAASAITMSSATVAGSIPSEGCSVVTAYGIEYSTTSGFANGTGTPVASSNLSGGNFSSALTGLAAGTVYYYHAYATNGGGTAYGTELSFTTTVPATPTLSATALTGFGNVCINTTTASNSFTINGSNLNTTNITVGPLTGFTFSTTAGGPFTSSLNLTQAGGAYSQEIFVQFAPTLVQSYNGNIPVTGGGATAIDVAASGSGVNTVPTLTAGTATAVTTTSATVPGTINADGCSAVTAYGIEYSATSGFATGTGISVAASNLSAGNFSSALSGLTQNTTYYYHAYATNSGGTGYSAELSFTTAATTPTINATSLAAFGNVCINTTAGPNSFTVNGSSLTTANISVGPLAGYSFSTTAGGTYTASLNLTQPGGTYSQIIYVKFTPTAIQSYNGNIPVSGGGAPATITVAASGAGVNTIAAVTTGAASSVTSISAVLEGSIVTAGCSAVTSYGVEYSTINGFANGTGTPVASTNLAGGTFSSNVTGLAASTVYYYHAYATNGGGTAYGTQQTFTTATPALSASTLTAFGNVCLNTTTAANSFTITGTNLTAANLTVGPLNGFTFSTTVGGTYTSSLNLTQPSGSYSQTIYVKFTPTAVQSYNGNIPVTGGGATPANVTASGAGINTGATVTTGAASAITQTTATAAGTVTSAGCSALVAYGIEYSTTNGFANGTGTAVPSTNIAANNFTSNLTGLSLSTTYYYHAYAANGGAVGYGAQQSFTTLGAVLTATSLSGFGNVCVNTTGGPNSFTITGPILSTANINVSGPAGYSFSTSATGTFTPTLSISQPGGAFSQIVFVKFTPTAVQNYTGNIIVTGGGATTGINVAVSGAGVNTAASVTTGDATNILKNSATLSGTVTATGCGVTTSYGIEYSSMPGFTNGFGIKLPGNNINAGNFSVVANNLVQGTKYYYKAYAITGTVVSYGAEKSFTTAAIGTGLIIYANPVIHGGILRYSIDNILPANYIVSIINSAGRMVMSRPVFAPVKFIDGQLNIPSYLAPGMYILQLRNTNDPGFVRNKAFMIL